MMTGEVGYNDLLFQTQGPWEGVVNGTTDDQTIPNLFPYTSTGVLITFICLLSLILMNLFFGITVHDVDHILKMSQLEQQLKLVNTIWRYEMVLRKLEWLTPNILLSLIKKDISKIMTIELDGVRPAWWSCGLTRSPKKSGQVKEDQVQTVNELLNHELKAFIER